MVVRGELTGADSANPFEQPRALIEAINVDNIVDSSGVGGESDHFKIDKRHVVREKHVRTFQVIHADFRDGFLLITPDSLTDIFLLKIIITPNFLASESNLLGVR